MTSKTFTFENPAEITLSAEDIAQAVVDFASDADTVDAASVYEYTLAHYGRGLSDADCALVMTEVERILAD